MNVRRLGLAAYEPTWHAMREFTAARSAQTAHELWLLEHPPVYTVGVAGRDQHLPRVVNRILVVRTDRDDQITYHGPGQIVLYTLLDLDRRGLKVRAFVRTYDLKMWRDEQGIATVTHMHALGDKVKVST